MCLKDQNHKILHSSIENINQIKEF